ncbi:SOLUTE CARRIER FAMILY 35 [Salix purpurea]|uniref:SOLUTE CARRIER FAMILY 35 n=1 Tax=Salix purpurea TaxID=77065 RepID=A0A9Q0VV32_SALPP|nr:SOLUTE CARRIER FAMILY 35 [Salix purpurea]
MGLLDSLLGNNARRFIKRKDSDAGEAGRALEELRGSLYNDIRTSEGAKRQQQRFCGPVVAMTFNFMAAVGVIMANKLVMKKFPLPRKPLLSLLSSHWALSWPLHPGLANASLNQNSVGFYQMSKIAVTPSIVLAEFIIFRKTISYKKVLALVVVSGGVAVATVKDLEFNFFGACIAIAWIVPSSINKILWSDLQQQANWTALGLMWKTTPVTVLFLVALMPCLDPPGVLSFRWDLYSSSAIFLTALLGFLLQWSGALALGATSATSHVVLGQFKSCVILLGGFLIFGSDPGFVSICGALTALAGMSVYTSLNLQESREKQIFQLQTQTLPLSKPKAISETTTRDEAATANAA